MTALLLRVMLAEIGPRVKGGRLGAIHPRPGSVLESEAGIGERLGRMEAMLTAIYHAVTGNGHHPEAALKTIEEMVR